MGIAGLLAGMGGDRNLAGAGVARSMDFVAQTCNLCRLRICPHSAFRLHLLPQGRTTQMAMGEQIGIDEAEPKKHQVT